MGVTASLIKANPETNERHQQHCSETLPHPRRRCAGKNEPTEARYLACSGAPCRETNAPQDSGRDELSKCHRAGSWLPKLPSERLLSVN